MRSRRSFAGLGRVVALGGIVGALLSAGLTPAGAVASRGAEEAGPAVATPHLAFTTTSGGAVAGAPFTSQPVVTIENATGAPTTANDSGITLSAETSTGGAATLTGCTQTTTSGVVTFTGCEIDTAGSYTLTASLTGFTPATSEPFTVSAGAAAQVVFSKEPSTITAGTTFSTAPELTVEDANGNVVTTGMIKLALAVTTVEPASAKQGSLVCTGGEKQARVNGKTAPVYGLAATEGSATFAGCTIDKASTTPYRLLAVATVTGTALSAVKSGTFDVNAGPPTRLVFTTEPTAAVLNEPFGVQPVVAVEDAAGNVVPTAGTVSLSIATGTGPSGATLQGCTGGTLSAGVATFSGCTLDAVGTGYQLSASLTLPGTTTITGTSSAFAVSAGPAAALHFVTPPGTGTGGAPLETQPVVTITDATGDLVSGTVELTLETTPSGVTLGCGADPAPAGTGTATFSGCTVNEDGTYHLVATDPDAPSAIPAVSAPFTITTGPAAKVVFTTSPSGSTGGVAFPTQPTVSVEDLGGNPVHTSTVVLGIAQGTGTAGAELTCAGNPTDKATAATGTVTFTGCAIDSVGTGYELTATATGKTGTGKAGVVGTSSPFDITLGPPAQLEFSAEPSGGTVSTPFGGQPQVTLTDAGGNAEHDSGVPVTLATSSGGPLTCLADPVPTNGTGVAVFAGCKTSRTGTLELSASGAGFSATSTPFTIVAGSPLGESPVGVPAGQTLGDNTLGTDPSSITDDVDSATGALDVQYADLKVAAVGEPFTLTRTYNSDDNTGGSFGPGWSSILDAGVRVAATGKSAVVRGPAGQQLVFTSDGKGGWTAPPGARATLSCQGTLCTVTELGGTVFQSIGGKVQDYLSADGVGLHFVYSQGRLVRITGSAEALLRGVETSLGQQVGTQDWTSTKAGSSDLTSVAALDSTHLWAVGDDCTLELSDDGGTAWTKDTNVSGCAAGTDLTGVTAGGGAGAVLAVGTGGTVLVCASNCDTASARWTGPSTSAPVPPVDVDFSSVWSPSPDGVLAVGTTTSGAGEIWACSADCAEPATSKPGPPAPKGSPRAGWYDVTPSGLTSTALTSISGRGGDLVVAVGAGGTVLVCDAPTCATSTSGWSRLTAGTGGTAPGSTVTFTGVWVAGPDDVEAVGTGKTADGTAGVIWACSRDCDAPTTGTSTSTHPGQPPAPRSTWDDVTPRALGATTLDAVGGEGAEVWAVGSDGSIWYCPDGCATEPTDWVSVGAPGGPDGLAGVTSSGPGRVWAVGAGGTVDAMTGPGSTVDALGQAIAELGAALAATRWVDGNDLSPGQGDRVFAQVEEAIEQLWQLAAPAPAPPAPGHHGTPPAPKPSISTAPAWDAAALLDLGQALRIVDENALSENVSAPRHASALGEGEADFTSAGSSVAAGQYPAAAADYQRAWAQALAASGSGQGSSTPLEVRVDENADGEVTSIGTPTRTVRYGYTGDLLTSYTDADGDTWTYTYTSTSGATPLLTTVAPQTGVTSLTVGYSASGRVAHASALGSQTDFDDTYTWTAADQTSTRSSVVQLYEGAPETTAEFLDEYAGNVLLAQQLPDGATTSYGYDSDLELTGTQDPLGQVDRMTYDSSGNLTSESTPAYGGTAVVRYTYGGDHQVESETDANGNTTKYAYTGGNLVEVTPPGPASDATRYRFNQLGEEYEAVGPTATETFSYDGAGNQTGYQLLSPEGVALDGLGPVFGYDEAGQVTVSTDPRGHTTSGLDSTYQTVDTYDADGELLSTTTPGTETTTTTYTPAGSVASVTEPTGAKTTYSWDEAALQLTSTASGTKTVSTYDPSGDLLAQTTGTNATTSYTYDPTGLETSKTGPTLVTTSYRYDIEGNVVGSTTSAGGSSTFTYDPANQVVTSTEDGVTTSVTYDLDGNITSKTDGAGTTTYTYNSRELMASVATAAGTTSYAYDPSGNLGSVTDGDGDTTRYQVNGAGERTEATVDGNATTYRYDVAGNLVSSTDPDGRTTTYTLNAEDERTEIAYTQTNEPTIDIQQTFDAAGQRTSVTNPTTGTTTTYTYNPGGELASATTAAGAGASADAETGTYGYTYKTAGEVIETYPDGTRVTYTYDDADSLMGVSTTTGIHVSYVRNAARRVTGIAYSNGILQTQGYDAAGLLTSMSLTCGGTTELTRATSFDAAEEPLAEATTVGGTTTTESYGYDSSGRDDAELTSTATAENTLKDTGCTSGTQTSTPAGNDTSGTTTHVTPPTTANQPVVPTEGTPGTGTSSNAIGYDAVGNITSLPTATNGTATTIGYDAADEVTSESGPDAASYTYDKNGDVTSETVGGVTTTYSYDAADQLVGVTDGTTNVTYTYDGNGNRTSRTVTTGGVSTRTDYSWDPDTTLPLLTLVCSGDCAGKANVVDQFVYGVGPVAMETHTGTYYLHEDQQGDVVAVSNSKGEVVETFRYDALGGVTATAEGTGTTTVPYEPLLFQSQYLTTATGLYDMRARDYDPASGTFLQRDPVAPAVGTPVFSPYSYADDQATASADPTGDESFSSMVDSFFYGHSTTTTDIVAATQLAIDVPKLGLKIGTLISKYSASTAAEAVNDVEGATSAIADAGADVADAAEEVSAAADGLGGLSEAATLSAGDLAGIGLSFAGVGLSTYITVEDCEHGSVSQCVGDAVGTAIGLACAIAGTAAAVVGTAGAAVPLALVACGLVAAALTYVIGRFGPQIAQGLAYLGQYAVEGFTDAYPALQSAFEDAGSALTGAYATVATEVSKGFSAAGSALTSAFGAARGVITTGFNELDSYISSGVSSALSTLESAGLSALGMAYVLKDELGEGLDTAVNELIYLGYDVDGVASALLGAFGQDAQEAAAILYQDFGYAYGEVASALENAFGEAAAVAAGVLEDIGATAVEIADVLETTFKLIAQTAAVILKDLDYTADQIAETLRMVFTEPVTSLVDVLTYIGITPTQIAETLKTVFSEPITSVAELLKEDIGITSTKIAGALSGAFDASAGEITTIFKTKLDEAATTAAKALENVYGESATEVTGLLKTATYGITQIEQALTGVFHLTTSEIESTLQNFFTTTVIAGLGGAFSTVGSFFTTTVGGFFTTTLGF